MAVRTMHENNKRLEILQKQPQEVFYEKGVLKNFIKFTEKHLCQSFFINEETLAHVLFCDYCEIFKNTFLTEELRVTASRWYKGIF